MLITFSFMMMRNAESAKKLQTLLSTTSAKFITTSAQEHDYVTGL